DNPVPKGAGFQATLTLNYSSDQLPDHPDFDETQLRVVSYDPTAGVAEILPTQLDTTAKTATAQLDHLAPIYSLAMLGPLSKSLLPSPLPLSGVIPSPALALDPLGSPTANGALAAFAADGTPLPGAPTLPIAPNAQQSGLVSKLFSPGSQIVSDSLQITLDQPTVTGVQIIGGSGLLDVLPLESAASDTWVLSLVEQTDTYNTQIHVANNA